MRISAGPTVTFLLATRTAREADGTIRRMTQPEIARIVRRNDAILAANSTTTDAKAYAASVNEQLKLDLNSKEG